MSFRDPAVQPATIDLDCRRELRVRWLDGQESVYPLELLRRACPCAACREASAETPPGSLRVVASATAEHDMVIARSAELVGHYALRITWQDGHAAGIYDFELLRALSWAGDAVGRRS